MTARAAQAAVVGDVAEVKISIENEWVDPDRASAAPQLTPLMGTAVIVGNHLDTRGRGDPARPRRRPQPERGRLDLMWGAQLGPREMVRLRHRSPSYDTAPVMASPFQRGMAPSTPMNLSTPPPSF